jgi:hypothetical protein
MIDYQLANVVLLYLLNMNRFDLIEIRDRTGIPFLGFFETGPNRDSGFWIPGDPDPKKFEKNLVPKIPVDKNQIPSRSQLRSLI